MAILGGMELTAKLAGKDKVENFFCFTSSVALAFIVLQSIIYKLSGEHVFLKILYRASMCFPVTWGFLCIVLPVLWMQAVGTNVKYFLIIFFLYLSIGNFKYGAQLLNEKWKSGGAQKFNQLLVSDNNRIDWAEMSKFMTVPFELYIPGVPRRWTPVISICLITSMLIGLNLRSIFPIFSVFAWGIPSLIITSFFFQLGGYIVMQAVKIRVFEKKRGITVMSAS
jgi:hypothetical protein